MAWNKPARIASKRTKKMLADKGYTNMEDYYQDNPGKFKNKPQSKRGKAAKARNAAKKDLERSSGTNNAALNAFRKRFNAGK